MSYALVWTPAFTRNARKFLKAHPSLSARFSAILRDLEVNPFQPHLRTHRLSGNLEGLHAVSLTYEYRMTLIISISEREIILLAVGSHDDACRR